MKKIALILLVTAILFAGCSDEPEKDYLLYKGEKYNVSQGDII